MSLRAQLEETEPERQDALLVRYGAEATEDELVDLVVTPPEPSGAFVPRRLEGLLVARGAGALPAISGAMLAQPRRTSTRRLAQVLAEVGRRHPDVVAACAQTVLETTAKALDQGGDTWAVGELLAWYLELVGRVGPSAGAAEVAARVLRSAAGEKSPYLLASDRARELLDRAGRNAGGTEQ